MQMSIIEVFICRRLHMNTSMILICIWLICRLGTTLHTKCCGAVISHMYLLRFPYSGKENWYILHLIHFRQHPMTAFQSKISKFISFLTTVVTSFYLYLCITTLMQIMLISYSVNKVVKWWEATSCHNRGGCGWVKCIRARERFPTYSINAHFLCVYDMIQRSQIHVICVHMCGVCTTSKISNPIHFTIQNTCNSSWGLS